MCGLYATASACLFTLLLNTYHSNKIMLNTGADKDEKHGRHIFLFSGSREELFGVGGERSVDWRKPQTARNDNQCCTAVTYI